MKCGRLIRRYLASALVAIICSSLVARLHAGTPPDILDDNRNDLTLEALETAAFTTALTVSLISLDPLTASPYPIVISGRVLQHPKIHNLYLDSDWDGNNPGVPTMAQLDAFTQDLANGPYLTGANGYGVQNATFTGSHGRSVFCTPVQPEFDHAEFVELLAWATCEVSFNPPPVPPGLLPSITGVPQTDDDTLYVIYLPPSMTVVDSDCPTTGYHFFGAAPNFKFDSDLGIPVPVFFTQTFAYAVVSTKCAVANGGTPDDIRNAITRAASHEIVEAATDPLVGTGWINDSVITSGSFFSDLVGIFSNVSLDLKAGEAADNCEAGTPTGPPVFGHPPGPGSDDTVTLDVTDSAVNNQIVVARYWSNALGKCVPDAPTSTLTFGSPNFPRPAGTFVTSNTVLTIDSTEASGDPNSPTEPAASLSYRYYPTGSPAPPYITGQPHVDLSIVGSDGSYTLDFFGTSRSGVDEKVHSVSVILDNTAPTIVIVAPAPIPYSHADTLTLNFSATDAGSGVQSTIVSIDGSSQLSNLPLANGRAIDLLTELSLGPHSFTVDSQDHVANDSNASVAFSIIVTADGIKQDVNTFLARGKIKNGGLANSLLAKLDAAASARVRGDCQTADNNYAAFINELQAQSGNGVDATAAAIMIGDAQYLIANCP